VDRPWIPLRGRSPPGSYWLLLQPKPRSADWIHQDLRHAAHGWVRGGPLGRHLILSSPAVVPEIALSRARVTPHSCLGCSSHRPEGITPPPSTAAPFADRFLSSSALSTTCRYRRSMSRGCDRSMRSAAISDIAAPSSSRGAPELAAGQVSGHCSSRHAASQNIHS